MRWCVSIGAVLVAGAIAAGDVVSVAAPDPRDQLADAKVHFPSVDVELVIAVDVSYSMDMDELAVQREGYAQAIRRSREPALVTPSGRVAPDTTSARSRACWMVGFVIPVPEGIGRGANSAVARLRRSGPTRGGAVWERREAGVP
jgi:hypothetical protein